MAAVEVTREARDELRELIETQSLPSDTRTRVSRSLLTLHEFPRAGKQLSGVWREFPLLMRPTFGLSSRRSRVRFSPGAFHRLPGDAAFFPAQSRLRRFPMALDLGKAHDGRERGRLRGGEPRRNMASMSPKPKVEIAREHLSKAQEEAGAGDLRDAVQ